jgi:hypothetical protein
MNKESPDSDLIAALESASAPEYDDDLSPGGHSVDRNIFTQSQYGVEGFSVIPLWVVREMVRARAHHAFALVLALLQRMRVKRIRTVLITSEVWDRAGQSGKWERQIALQHLRRIPGVIKLEERHKRQTRYQATLGEMWPPQ